MTAGRCAGKRADGSQCEAFAVDGGDGYCFSHAPGLAAQRTAARSAGGAARAQQQRADRADVLAAPWLGLRTVEDCEAGLAHVAAETLAGRMGAREATAATRTIEILLRQARDYSRHGERYLWRSNGNGANGSLTHDDDGNG